MLAGQNVISAIPGYGGLSAGIQGEDLAMKPPQRQRDPPEQQRQSPIATSKTPDDSPQLYQMPDLTTPLSMFDTDDLHEDAVFILHSPPSVSLQHSGRQVQHLCVWVGNDVRGLTEMDFHKFAKDFEKIHNLEGQVISTIIESGDETDAFWELFPDG